MLILISGHENEKFMSRKLSLNQAKCLEETMEEMDKIIIELQRELEWKNNQLELQDQEKRIYEDEKRLYEERIALFERQNMDFEDEKIKFISRVNNLEL